VDGEISKLTPPHGAEASHEIAAGNDDAEVTTLDAAGSESTLEYVFGAGGAALYGGYPGVGENGSYG